MQGAGLLADDEDVVNDLIGYLVLLKIGMNDEKNKEMLISNGGQEIFEEGLQISNYSLFIKNQYHRRMMMEYKDLIENYTPELELIDALNYLKDQPWLASEILDHLASRSSNEKTDVKSLLKDQIL